MSETNYLGMPDREDSLVSRTTLLIVACYFALTLSMLPWAQRPGPELPGLVPFFVAGVVVTELATSFLLFFSFSAARSWSLLLLASAYLYSGLMPIAHLLTFPGAVFPEQAVVGTQQSTGWIFIAWILGYALITAMGVLAEARQPALRVAPEKVTRTLTNAALAAVVAVLVITFAAANWAEQLPPLINPNWTTLNKAFVCLITATLVATVVFILAKLGDADEIFLWLAMALTAIAAANVISAAGGGRYTLGWTLGRLSWVISASVLFLYFMRQYARDQRLLVRTAEILEQRVAARTSELEASNALLGRSLDERNVLLRDVQHKTVALTESRARLAGVVDSAMDAIISVDERHQVVSFNAAAERMFQREAQDVLGRELGQLLPARYRAAHRSHIDGFAQMGVTTRAMGKLGTLSALRADGTEFPIEASISQCSIGGERLFTVILRDIAERKRAENALAQSQRMDALGQLTGGIAHDFNNVLAAISSNLDAVTLRSTDAKIHHVIQNAMDAIQMGANLTRRLLLLSSRREVGLERLDLNDRVTGTIELLRRTLGEQVTVSLRLSPDPCQISANPGDVDNAIVNLAINARDAMPSGGVLTIETGLASLDADVAGHIANARPGEYVMLTVSDTGLGMSPDVVKRAMEPFFTTKEPGMGTGLGLATIHSTVRQSGGFVAIDSTEGDGTSVHLYFPKAEPGPIVSRAAPTPKEAPFGDGELILLVEDNDKVRKATARRLEGLGYAVLEANTGPKAITLLESGEPIALVFSDIVMPGGMTGYDVTKWVQSIKPEVKVLMTSGYSDMPLAAIAAARKIKVLGKPYTREQLACALREALDS